VEVWVFYKNNTSDNSPDEKLSISNADIELSGSGAPAEGTTLLVTDTAQEYTLKITYGGVSVTISYSVLGSSFVLVGVDNEYSIPIQPTPFNPEDSFEVQGGYEIATTETTYELWYAVYTWATDEERGDEVYSFQNAGQEGNDGINGAAPTSAKKEPVTMVSWRDVIVWTNSLSEMTGLDPVYRTSGGTIIRDSRDSNANQVDGAVETDNNGYRLPSANEWEMAARWRDGSEWTPADYASGATAGTYDIAATSAVAWYPGNTEKTQTVGTKLPNELGIHDMSGNVFEWCFSWDDSMFLVSNRGGSYFFDQMWALQVSDIGYSISTTTQDSIGFRIVKNGPLNNCVE
jgi:hypothetical protein